jgi:hypothetical protein
VAKPKTLPAELVEVLSYDPLTGIFTWTDKARLNRGKIAGTINAYGYVVIMFKRKCYMAHRVAFLFMGKPLTDEVDHIDGDRTNNRWSNLREATRTEQCRNLCRTGKRPPGVSKVKRGRFRWQAYIWHENKMIHLGYFVYYREAVEARKGAEEEYGYHPNHGRKKASPKHNIQEIRKAA